MGRLAHADSSSLTVTTSDDMKLIVYERSSEWRARLILWLIRRWFPQRVLAKVERWPIDGPSSVFESHD